MNRIILLLAFVIVLSPALAIARNKTVPTERRQFQEKAQELKNAKPENKEELKAQVLSRAKTLAIKSVDRLILKYTHFIGVVEKLPNISDQNKAEYKIKIDAEIEKLKAKKAEITATTTSAEVKAIMETVKAQARQSNQAVKLMVAAIKKTHLENIILKIGEIIVALENRLSVSSAPAEELVNYQNMISEAKLSLNSARTNLSVNKLAEAKDDLLQAKNTLSGLSESLATSEEE